MPVDGNLDEWTAAERLDLPGSGSGGYELYGRVEGSGAAAKLVFAIRAPAGTSIGGRPAREVPSARGLSLEHLVCLTLRST